MDFTTLYEKFNDKEKNMFSIVANKLLNNCFLSKDKKDNKDAYYFVLNYKRAFDEYFRIIDWEVVLIQDTGAVQLLSTTNKNLLRLKKTESVILILLRILYQEKISNFTDGGDLIKVRVDDIHQKYDSLEYRKKIYKTDLVAILRMFRKFNLIEPLGDVTKGSCEIIIYPTILLAINNLNLDVLYNTLQNYEGGITDEKVN